MIDQLADGGRPVRPGPIDTPQPNGAPRPQPTGQPTADRAGVPATDRIRASALARILIGQSPRQANLTRGIHISGYRIVGDLDLSQAHRLDADQGRAAVPMIFDDCIVEGVVNLAGARTGSVVLRDTQLVGFCARGADIGGQVTLDGCTIHAVVASTGAAQADAGAGLASAGQGALTTAAARSAIGRIDLDGCSLGGDLSARGLRVMVAEGAPSGQVEIDADNARIQGSVNLCERLPDQRRAEVSGAKKPVIYANFDNAEIFGDFDATGVQFAPPTRARSHAPTECLDLRGAQIRGDLCLEHISARGRIRLEDADIAQDLELGGAFLSAPRGIALDAQGLVVHGSVHLVDREVGPNVPNPVAGPGVPRDKGRDPRLLAHGQLRFSRARISGDFDASGATVCALDVSIEGVAIDLRSAEFGGSVYLDGRRDVGPGFFVGLINMIQVHVSGSIVLSGSWFRAPCGQMMGPEWIDAEIYDETAMRRDLTARGIDPDSAAFADFSIEDIYYGHEHDFWDTALDSGASKFVNRIMNKPRRRRPGTASPQPSRKSPAVNLLTKLKIKDALTYSASQLWRLRGGCRAIALEDARIGGAVLFGTAIDIHTFKVPGAKKGRSKSDGGDGVDANGPSVVVGAVDMDRAQIDGELRLTGGIFRAVTPVVKHVSRTEPGPAASESPDPSLSYPSTVGWTELMARTCLSLRGARIGGRLETRFFGALPVNETAAECLKKKDLKAWRKRLHLVPKARPVASGRGAAGTAPADRVPAHQEPTRYADEILFMLAFVSRVESLGDRRFGATYPSVPMVQRQEGGYHLRPDGAFDLSDCQIQAIYDHPCHGWPTSDGHVLLNGCRYEFISLEPDASLEHPEAGRDPAAKNAQSSVGKPAHRVLRRAQGLRPSPPRSWRGRFGVSLLVLQLMRLTNLIGCAWGRALQASLLPYLLVARILRPIVRVVRLFLGYDVAAVDRDPGHRAGIEKQWSELRAARRETRYRTYARRSFWQRNDDRCRPAARRIAWLEQQYHGADPTPQDFLPQPYETMCRVMRANGYREDADRVASAKRRQRSRATLRNPLTLGGEWFLRLTSDYGYSPARVVFVSLFVVACGGATVQLATEHELLIYESLATEGVSVVNALNQANKPDASDISPREDLALEPFLYAIDRFVPVVEIGYVQEWTTNEWVKNPKVGEEPPYVLRQADADQADASSPWPAAVRSALSFDGGLLCAAESTWDGAIWLAGEILRLPLLAIAFILGWVAILGDWLMTALFALNLSAPLNLSVKEFWSARDPEVTIRWIGAIYHSLGWALLSMAIVTFTGVIRRD